jgi:hypothetical protein
MQRNSKTFPWVIDVCTNADDSEWLNNHRPRCTSVMATLGSFLTQNRRKMAHMKRVSRTFNVTKAYCEKK